MDFWNIWIPEIYFSLLFIFQGNIVGEGSCSCNDVFDKCPNSYSNEEISIDSLTKNLKALQANKHRKNYLAKNDITLPAELYQERRLAIHWKVVMS